MFLNRLDPSFISQEYDLGEVKTDLFKVLNTAPWEAEAVRIALTKGEIAGYKYGGRCCCIKGIIAKNLGISISELNKFYGIKPDAMSPMEAFLVNIWPSDKPENSAYAKFIMDCLDEFIAGLDAKQAANLGASVQAGLDEVLAGACELPVVEEKSVPELVQV